MHKTKMGTLNYYSILQISSNASIQEIKRSFRTLSKMYHPDANPDKAESDEKFINILNSYEVLSDLEKRREYDQRSSTADNYDNYNPYEPKYKTITDIIRITNELKEELRKIALRKEIPNVNAVFTILNHVLNPSFIYSEINTKDAWSKNEIICNIVYCYHFLPVNIIELLQLKLDLLNYNNEEVQTIIKKIIRKKKITEEIDLFLNNTPGWLFFILILLALGVIVGIIDGLKWIMSLFH